MAETLLFTIPAPTVNEEPAFRLHWHQSIDGNVWGAVIDTILVSELGIDTATGKYIWTSANADPTKYHTIRTETEDGSINIVSQTIPPRYEFAMTEIYADLRDFELLPQSGVEFTITPKTSARNGVLIDAASEVKTTNSDGILSVFVPQNTQYEITSTAIGGRTLSVRSSNKTFINLAVSIGC